MKREVRSVHRRDAMPACIGGDIDYSGPVLSHIIGFVVIGTIDTAF
jgi:hypothetical protein